MRRLRLELLAVAVALASCETAPVADPADVRAGQVQACAVVVAEHVGMAVEEVTPTWRGVTASGTAVIWVEAPGRPHSCEVDDQLRVLQLQHPGAE